MLRHRLAVHSGKAHHHTEERRGRVDHRIQAVATKREMVVAQAFSSYPVNGGRDSDPSSIVLPSYRPQLHVQIRETAGDMQCNAPAAAISVELAALVEFEIAEPGMVGKLAGATISARRGIPGICTLTILRIFSGEEIFDCWINWRWI